MRIRETINPPAVVRGFVTGQSIRDDLREEWYVVPSTKHVGRQTAALRIEAQRAYVSDAALDDILDYAEWRLAQESMRPVLQDEQPARPQLVL